MPTIHDAVKLHLRVVVKLSRIFYIYSHIIQTTNDQKVRKMGLKDDTLTLKVAEMS